VKRRDLLKAALASVASGFSRTSGVRGSDASTRVRLKADTTSSDATNGSVASGFSRTTAQQSRPDADYIVVGSGAGGGTVAARLAEAGYTVMLLEAGGDPRSLSGGDAIRPSANTLPADYDVPAFHPSATENDAMKWDFYVRHYADTARQALDPKYLKEHDGVWYPRAGTLGGCTAHNALILAYPHNTDWDELADLTGDPTWRADHMRTYFERIENCGHRPFERLRGKLGWNPSRHGWSGWLNVEKAAPEEAIRDRNLRGLLWDSVHGALEEIGRPTRARLESQADPNDWRVVRDGEIGVRYTPLTTKKHQRVGTRERVLEVRDRHPDRLKIEMNALATRVIFEGTRAVGVEYQKGERLYRADSRPAGGDGEVRQARAGREVILAGGAFNTPQLLMLSGIGPPEVLARNQIAVKVPLAGVGRNLQDRYEVAVVNRMNFPAWDMLHDATFTTDDAPFRAWANDRKGIYTTNGAVLSVIARSMVDRPVPDLFCYALLADFRGYKPGYSKVLPEHRNYLTWVVLKGHTANTAGEVTLRSPNPRDTPVINFHYFDEGNDGRGEDLKAVVEGIKLVRKLGESLRKQGHIAEEEEPGPNYDDDKKLMTFVQEHAWGHHASCTCAIGPRDSGGVLSGDFKVHGTEGLRVVDASVFPRAPGLFIVSAIYMIGEKAADVIIQEAKRRG
jgi:choline dehydrogenase-like flavoprotein